MREKVRHGLDQVGGLIFNSRPCLVGLNIAYTFDAFACATGDIHLHEMRI